LRKALKKAGHVLVRIIFPAPLLDVPENGLRKKFCTLFRHELCAHSSPVKLSLSLSLGVFMAILPIHGFQVIMVLLLAVLFHLNRPLAMVGVSVSSAPLLPFWIAAGVAVGDVIVPSTFAVPAGEAVASHLPVVVLDWVRKLPVPGILESVVKWFFGSIALAVLCSIGTFCLSYPLIKGQNVLAMKNGKPNQNP
jgi:uncharacterized protein (DUF2062 family)